MSRVVLQLCTCAQQFVVVDSVVVVAGFGKSKNAHYDNERSFVEQFVKGVKLDRPVLICASMSGSFALPFVLRPEAATCTQRLRGFVPIAPVGTSAFSQADYKSCKVSFREQQLDFQFHVLKSVAIPILEQGVQCLQLLEILEIDWNLKSLLEISSNLIAPPGNFFIIGRWSIIDKNDIQSYSWVAVQLLGTGQPNQVY